MRRIDVTWFHLDNRVVTTVELLPLLDEHGEPAGYREERTRCRVNVKGNIINLVDLSILPEVD